MVMARRLPGESYANTGVSLAAKRPGRASSPHLLYRIAPRASRRFRERRGLPAGGLGVSPILSLKGVQGRSPAGGLGVSPILSLKGVQGRSPAGGLGVSPNSIPT